MARILLVDDELSIIDFVSYNLQKLGHSVEVARDGSEALSKLQSTNPDLLILDIMLPGMDGYEVLKRVREKGNFPVLMLSSLDTTTDIVLGLELGADDYMTKPFSVRELQARVKALLRRSDPATRDRRFTHGALVLDVNARSCLWGGNELDLTQKEFDLLYYLMLNRGLALTRAKILDAVSVRELQARVKALLRRLDPAPRGRRFTHGALVLDVNARSCLWGGNELDLTQKEFDLLYYLMLNRGLALTRAKILDAVWGYDSAGGDRTVDTHVKTLRAKLREAGAGDPIETLRGVGYRFTAEKPD